MTPARPVSDQVVAVLDAFDNECQAWPEQEEGPYHRDGSPRRRDVTEGRDGVALGLGIRLRAIGNGPLDGAEVEIWHCDSSGRYSGSPPPDVATPAEGASTAARLPEETFLRGRQLIDSAGTVEFRTIYPGWYPGRTVHIHVMVHTDRARYTTQVYFPEQITDDVFGMPPYRDRPERATSNTTDAIFRTGGEPAVLHLVPDGGGYLAGICLLLDEPQDRR